MHIPDGLISINPITSTGAMFLIITSIITIIALAFVIRRYGFEAKTKSIPLIAMFIVAAVVVQFIELPLPLPICTHIYLVSIIALYDLDTSIIVYTFVTIIQAIYGEGGITTLGPDLLNLAIIAPIVAYYLYKLLNNYNKNLALFISGFGAVTVIGLIVSIEYALVGLYPITFGLTVILPIEAGVGVLEGIVTVLVMNALKTVKPELAPVLMDK